MTFSIAHLGPAGSYAEQAAINYAHWFQSQQGLEQLPILVAEPTITQTMYAIDEGKVDLAGVPVENSIEGGVSFTLDTLWKLKDVVIYEAFILPINHMFIAQSNDLSSIEAVYSHPQALGQCQTWLGEHVPQAQLIPSNSTAEGLKFVRDNPRAGAIASERAANLNQLPIQVRSIQDHRENCTKFWVFKKEAKPEWEEAQEHSPTHCSLAFIVPDNIPGALLNPLTTFSQRQINLSRIESRPAKKALGDYVFFIDAEVKGREQEFQSALEELRENTRILKIFGTYPQVSIPHQEKI